MKLAEEAGADAATDPNLSVVRETRSTQHCGAVAVTHCVCRKRTQEHTSVEVAPQTRAQFVLPLVL